jgi:ribosome-associated protein
MDTVKPPLSETSMQARAERIRNLALAALDDGKALDVRTLDVRPLTDVTDFMIVAGATSRRHAQSLADRVCEAAREADARALGVEGEETGEWILIDLGDAVVHVMQPEAREFYDLEKLWSEDLASLVAARRERGD